MYSPISWVVSFLLLGCGGGGDDPAPCVPATSLKVVVGIGDSLQADADPASTGRPNQILQALLNQRYPGVVTVTDVAVPGANSSAALTQGPLDGDIYVSDIGLTNDASAMTNGQPGQFPISESTANMAAFLALVPGKVVIWQTPAVIDTTVVSPPFQTDLQAQAMVAFAQAHGQAVADVRSAELAVAGWQGMTLDGLHWNPALVQTLTTNVTYPPVQAAVAKLMCQG